MVGSIALVVLAGGAGFYFGALAFYGGTWEVIVSAVFFSGLLGGSTYKFVASPVINNYDQTRIPTSELEFLLNKLQEDFNQDVKPQILR